MRLALKDIEVCTSVVDGTLIQIISWHCPLKFRLFEVLKCSVCWKIKTTKPVLIAEMCL